jgi:hypothetical protein
MRWIVPGLVAVLLFPAAAAAQSPTVTPAPTPVPEPVIPGGVLAGGIDVGGLTTPQARARIRFEARPRLRQDVVVRVAGRRFALRMKRLRYSFDAERSAWRAYRRGIAAPPPPPTETGGAVTQLSVPLVVRYERAVLRQFAARVHRLSYTAPRDATIRITLRRMRMRGSRAGREVDIGALAAALRPMLKNASVARVAEPGRVAVPARVRTRRDLAKRYPTVVTVDRGGFKLRLFKRLRLTKTYRIAVGAAGYETPTGLYSVHNKAVNPAWSAPNKPWAGLYAGTTVPGGAPDNPLKARWLGIVNGVGIHGTGVPGSIGTRASHGCIRMTVSDVIDLYPRVPIGTPVLIR